MTLAQKEFRLVESSATNCRIPEDATSARAPRDYRLAADLKKQLEAGWFPVVFDCHGEAGPADGQEQGIKEASSQRRIFLAFGAVEQCQKLADLRADSFQLTTMGGGKFLQDFFTTTGQLNENLTTISH